MTPPVDVIIQSRPEAKKRIQLCMRKWHSRTSGPRQWPLNGSVEKVCLDEVENNIRHYKAKDRSPRREGKRAIEREVLMWFRQAREKGLRSNKRVVDLMGGKIGPQGEGSKGTHPHQSTVQRPPPYTAVPTAPPPPPAYPSEKNPFKAGQYPLSTVGDAQQVSGAFEGELQGKFTFTLGGEPEGKDLPMAPHKRSSPERRGSIDSNKSMLSQASGDSAGVEGADLKNVLNEAQDRMDYCRAEMNIPPTGSPNVGKNQSRTEMPGRSTERDDCKRILEKLCRKQWMEESGGEQQHEEDEGAPEERQETSKVLVGQAEAGREQSAMKREAMEKQTRSILDQLFQRNEETNRRLNASMQELRRSLQRVNEAADTRLCRSNEGMYAGPSNPEDQEYHWEMEEQIPTMTSTPQMTGSTGKTVRRAEATGVMRLQLEGTIRPGESEEEDEQDEEDGRDEGEAMRIKPRRQRRQWPEPAWRRDAGRLTKRQEDKKLDNSYENAAAKMLPIISKGPNQVQCYVPWSFMDMIGLAAKLPALTEGANRWITALEESTAGIKLALGDIKALLMHMAGKTITEEIFAAAQLDAVVRGNAADHVGFGGHRNRIWAELRKQYPEKMDPSKLEGEKLAEGECPAKFLHKFQRKWKEETGEAWNSNLTTQSLFKLMVKKAMPAEVQKRLDNVVGLTKMEWPLFSEHIIHHVDNYRKEKRDTEEQNKQLATKLTQMQLGEMAKQQKKDKEKAKIQAPVVTATPDMPQDLASQAPALVQSPSGTPPEQKVESPAPALTSPPAIHVHVNTMDKEPSRDASLNRGRGRGRQASQPQYSPNGYRTGCYGCGRRGHIKRDCPTLVEISGPKWE